MTLRQARELAQEKLHTKAKGYDPPLVRREERQRAKEAKTVSDLCEAFLERHSKASKKICAMITTGSRSTSSPSSAPCVWRT